MSDKDPDYEVLVPASATKWVALIGGLLLPLALAVMAAHIYGAEGGQTAQVFPLPEE